MKKFVSSSLIIFTTACGTGATIHTYDGAVYEGTIRGHNADYVRIGRDMIDAKEIEDIDHPGNVAGIIGTIVTGIGALGAQENCKEENRAANPDACAGSGVWILTGIPIAIYGWVTHSNSVTRAGQ